MRAVAFVLVGLLLAGCGGPREPVRHPTAPATRTTAPTAPTRAVRPVPAIRPVSAKDIGASWHPGCPVGPAGLRAVTVPYFGFDGHRHEGTLIVAAEVAPDVVTIFTRIYAAHFPIRRVVPISAYGGDDERSMAADNSSAFNCRPITGGTGWSKHAYGDAIDINTVENPYVSGGVVEPGNGRKYVDRSARVPGMIHAGGPVVSIFAELGWIWGGSWTNPIDYQHFQFGN